MTIDWAEMATSVGKIKDMLSPEEYNAFGVALMIGLALRFQDLLPPDKPLDEETKEMIKKVAELRKRANID